MNRYERHKEICNRFNEIYRAKNADYGDSFSKTFNEFGLVSAVIRISDKCERLKNLCENKALVESESAVDTLMDMANYCIMTVVELNNEEDSP